MRPGPATNIESPEDSNYDTNPNNHDTSNNNIQNPPPAQLLPNLNRGSGVYALEFYDENNTWLFECSAYGGKILSFKLNGVNIVADQSVGETNGSTFWTSPQSDWNWPPPAEIDSAEYSVAEYPDTGTIIMASPIVPSLNVQIIKEFSVDLHKKTVTVTYSIKNVASNAQNYAPWEITRVAPGGITFYPTGEGTPHSGSFSPIPTSQLSGITWFEHIPQNLSGNHKLFADGADGWIAHTDKRLLLVKTFKDEPLSAAAPDEAEIEIFATSSYVEVEQQGAYSSIAPDQTYTWAVTWHLKALDQGANISAGSDYLVQSVNTLIQ